MTTMYGRLFASSLLAIGIASSVALGTFVHNSNKSLEASHRTLAYACGYLAGQNAIFRAEGQPQLQTSPDPDCADPASEAKRGGFIAP